jgi:hypothetical protein
MECLFLLRPLVTLGLVVGVPGRVFYLAEGILHFALNLFPQALGLLFFVPGPFADLTLDSARNVFRFTLYLVFIHITHLRLVCGSFFC